MFSDGNKSFYRNRISLFILFAHFRKNRANMWQKNHFSSFEAAAAAALSMRCEALP
jgi:hypothetical protein